MLHSKRIRNLIFCCLVTACISGLTAPYSAGQSSGAVPLPSTKPRVDQLGQMEGVPGEDRFWLVVGLSLQAIACVAVAIALAGHLSLPNPKKKPKA